MKKKRQMSIMAVPRMSVIYALILLPLFVIMAFFVYSATVRSQEENRLVKLREDIQILESDLNKVNNGWEYDEYCTGYGSDIARNNKKVCYVRLENSNASTDKGVIFKDYVSVIDSSRQFKQVGLTSMVPTGSTFTQALKYSTTDGQLSCSLRAVTSSKEEVIGTSLFMCFRETKDFYFERRDG